MKDYWVYYPYKAHSFCVPVVTGVCVLSFIATGWFISQRAIFAIFWFVLGVICLLCTKYLRATASIFIVLNSNGVQIATTHYNDVHFVPWDHLKYACYGKSFKGHRFLLLSQEKLDKTQVKNYVLAGAKGNSIWFKSVVVIHIDPTQEVSKIEEIVSNQGLEIE